MFIQTRCLLSLAFIAVRCHPRRAERLRPQFGNPMRAGEVQSKSDATVWTHDTHAVGGTAVKLHVQASKQLSSDGHAAWSDGRWRLRRRSRPRAVIGYVASPCSCSGCSNDYRNWQSNARLGGERCFETCEQEVHNCSVAVVQDYYNGYVHCFLYAAHDGKTEYRVKQADGINGFECFVKKQACKDNVHCTHLKPRLALRTAAPQTRAPLTSLTSLTIWTRRRVASGIPPNGLATTNHHSCVLQALLKEVLVQTEGGLFSGFHHPNTWK